jgi:hypothetical protein
MTASTGEPDVYIGKDRDKKFTIIPLFEDSLRKVKDLVQDFMNKYPTF